MHITKMAGFGLRRILQKISRKSLCRSIVSFAKPYQKNELISVKEILQKQQIESNPVHVKFLPMLAYDFLNNCPMCARSFTFGSLLECTGHLQKSQGALQEYDLIPETIAVIGTCPIKEYPIKQFFAGAKHGHTPDYLRQYLHLRCKTSMFAAQTRLRNAATHAVHGYFQGNDYLEIHTPILTSNDCEGAGDTFEVKPSSEELMQSLRSKQKDTEKSLKANKLFFGQPAYLTVSGQLHLEAYTGAFNRVYAFNPTFRAENSPGRLHLSEFYMVVESLLKTVTQHLLDKHAGDLEEVWFYWSKQSDRNKMKEYVEQMQKRAEHLIEKPFIRLDYGDAIKLLEEKNNAFTEPVQWGKDLRKEHELELVKLCDEVPVFVQNYPADIKPFYCRNNDDEKTVACVDLIAQHVGELCGGSLREERYDVLNDKLTQAGLEKNYRWYLDLRRFGCAPHGGFGIGFERYLMMLFGCENIRDALPFPRSVRQCRL